MYGILYKLVGKYTILSWIRHGKWKYIHYKDLGNMFVNFSKSGCYCCPHDFFPAGVSTGVDGRKTHHTVLSVVYVHVHGICQNNRQKHNILKLKQ